LKSLHQESARIAWAGSAAQDPGAEPEALRITPARFTPLWDGCDTPQSEAAGGREPDWDFVPKAAPDDPFDQCISW
jgi:hypothetical protein